MQQSVAFACFEPHLDLTCSLGNQGWPVQLRSWRAGKLALPDGGTHFGFVHDGHARLTTPQGVFDLAPGMYFATAAASTIEGAGTGMVIFHQAYEALFHIGGPVENKGRLRYIDGCTDSLLIPPVLLGDPCLNLLHFPPGIDQTSHVHPSPRLGMVARGKGICRLPDRQVDLSPGRLFHIPTDVAHAFATTGSAMTVIAYHPDSDFGPQHQNHPMINRTIVNGTSANQLTHIQTGGCV